MLNLIFQGHGSIPEEDIINFLEIGREIEISRITEIKNLISAPKSSLDGNNAIKIVSNKDTIEFSVKYIFFQNAILSYKWVLYKYGFLELY